jgi:hypothetical protein
MAANNDWSALRVQDAAVAVLRAEMAGRGVALAARVAEMQRKLVAAGSALEWLSRAGAFREAGGRHGEAADESIRHTVLRMESTPSQWTMSTNPRDAPFAVPTGAQRWQAAFEALKRDATAALPDGEWPMVTESMDLDAIQAKLIETSNIAWLTLVALNAGFSGMTAAAYIASLPRLPLVRASCPPPPPLRSMFRASE